MSDDPIEADEGLPAGPALLRIPRERPLILIGILGWLVPGLGQLAMGRVRKALVMGLSIGVLYVLGLALAGFVCVVSAHWLESIAHALAAGPTLLTLHLTEDLVQDRFLPHLEVGRLYVAVASLLNVVSVSDALGDALRHNTAVRHLRSLRDEASDEDLPPPSGDVAPEPLGPGESA